MFKLSWWPRTICQYPCIKRNTQLIRTVKLFGLLWKATFMRWCKELRHLKKIPRKKVLVITDCSLNMFDCKWASIRMEKGSYGLEYCYLEFNTTRLSDMSWELMKKFKRLSDLLWPAVWQTMVKLDKRTLLSASCCLCSQLRRVRGCDWMSIVRSSLTGKIKRMNGII